MDFDSSPIVLTIKVLQATNCKGSKTSLNSFVRVQFADYDYKDTITVVDNLNPEFGLNFEQTFNVDENLIEVFANKPITFTLNESLPKDKSSILGSGELHLYRHFLGYFKREVPIPECPLSFSSKVPINYANPKMLAANQETPSVLVEIALSRPLLTPAQLTNSVFLTIVLDDVRPVPEEWTLREGNEKDPNSNLYSYNTSLKLPTNAAENRIVTIPNGNLILGEYHVEEDPCMSAPQGIVMNEDADYEGIDHHNSNQNDDSQPAASNNGESKIIVRWNNHYIVWLSPPAIARLREESHRKIELEFSRLPLAKFSAFTDANAHKVKAKAIVDLSIAMNPNIIGIKGRFNLEAAEPFHDSKTTQEEAHHKAKKVVSDMYKAVNSTIGLTLVFSIPIISKKKLEQITKSVSDYIPKRPLSAQSALQKRYAQAEADYKDKIKEIVHQLVNEYKQALLLEVEMGSSGAKGNLQTQNANDEEKRKKLFMFHLNKSGAYFNMKEQLKASVVHIVREKFKKRSPFAVKSELQLFMSEIYVYLMDEMHTVLNQIYEQSGRVQTNTQNELFDIASLKSFADEAEWSRQKSVAAKYHQQRIAKYDENLNAWFDYSCFCLRNQLASLGEEGIREVLSRNAKHVPSLIGHGLICLSAEKFMESKTFLEKALELEPENIIAQTSMGLFFESMGDEFESDRLFALAKETSSRVFGVDKHFFVTAEFAIQLNCGDIADKVLAQELVLKGPAVEPYLLMAALEVQRDNISKGMNALNQALEINKSDPCIWSEIGHLHYIQGKFPEAKVAFETALSMKIGDKKQLKVDLVYLRLGHIYLKMAHHPTGKLSNTHISQLQEVHKVDEVFARIAKNMYLNACAIRSSSQTWLGVGRACFALKDYVEAEDAFSEANIMNNRDSEVWAHLALLCLTVGRFVEANQAIAQALRLGVKDTEILRLVGVAFLDAKQPNAAVELFRMAVENDPQDESLKSLFSDAVSAAASDEVKIQATVNDIPHSNGPVAGLAM